MCVLTYEAAVRVAEQLSSWGLEGLSTRIDTWAQLHPFGLDEAVISSDLGDDWWEATSPTVREALIKLLECVSRVDRGEPDALREWVDLYCQDP